MNSTIFQEYNPWWRRPEFILEDIFLEELKRQKYPYYHPLYNDLPIDRDGILTLRGPRRIGKTTLLKLIIRRLLLDEKQEAENIFFFPCDTVENFRDLEEILRSYLDYIRPRSDARVFIFLDEISFVKEWQRAVKLLADSGRLRNALVLITGSSILDLKYSSERLPGRRGDILPWDHEFLPLTFREFITLLKPELLSDPLGKSLSLLPYFARYFSDYLLCGGFPLTINEYFEKGYISPQTYEIFLAWISGDLHHAGKSENFLYQIIRRVLVHLTTPVSFLKLSRESGVSSHSTAQEYIDILEKMYVLTKIHFFSLEQKQALFRKNCKIYFSDPFIFNCLKSRADGFSSTSFPHSKEYVLNDTHRPLLVENAVCLHLGRAFSPLYFGHSSREKEIDFVGMKNGSHSYFEVKYSAKVTEKDFSWVHNLIGTDRITVISRKDYHDNLIPIIPAEMFLAYFPHYRKESG